MLRVCYTIQEAYAIELVGIHYSRLTCKDAASERMDNPSINYNLRSGVMNTKCSVCGIDIGKDFSYYCVLDPSSQVYLKPFKANNDASGLKDAIRRLKKAEEALGTKPAIVLESTGHYSSRLVYFFIRNNFKVFLINPLQSHSIKNINIRKVKTDKIDCEEIARLFFILNLREYEMPNDEMANLKILTRSNYHLSQQRVQVVNQLRSEIDQVWPEFTKIFADIASKTVLSLLTAYPAPANLLAAPKKKIVALIMSNSRRGKNYALKRTRPYKGVQKMPSYLVPSWMGFLLALSSM